MFTSWKSCRCTLLLRNSYYILHKLPVIFFAHNINKRLLIHKWNPTLHNTLNSKLQFRIPIRKRPRERKTTPSYHNLYSNPKERVGYKSAIHIFHCRKHQSMTIEILPVIRHTLETLKVGEGPGHVGIKMLTNAVKDPPGRTR